MAEERAAAEIPGTPEFRAVRMAVIGLMLGLLLSSLDFVIVAAAMRTIADQLHGQTVQAWATTAYMVTATIATPLFGKLSDLYGRKKLYMAAIGIFLVGSLLASAVGGAPEPGSRARFDQLVSALADASLCGHGTGLAAFARSLARHHPEEVARCLG